MTTHDIAAGQILVAGIYGTSLSSDTARSLRKGHFGGVILMGRNVESPQQVRELLGSVIDSAAAEYPPPLLGVDQEGGRVARLKTPVVSLPPARRFGEIGDPTLTRRAMTVLGRQMRALGFTLDFAPVLDVEGGGAREVIGDRSYSGEPEQASLHGVAAVGGLIEAGICPCGKHFPGHGATIQDSHESLPRVTRARDELDDKELLPFKAAIAAQLPLLMPAHVIFEALDEERPATFSPKILVELLRGELGYEGVVVTDDLKMGAVSEAGGAVDVALEALMAGADLLLLCHDEELQHQLRESVADAARKSPAVAKRLESASNRAMKLRRRFLPQPSPIDEIDALLASTDAAEVVLELEGHLGQQ